MNEQKSHYVYGIFVGMSFLCSKPGHDQKDQDRTDFVWCARKYMVNKGLSFISGPGWPCYYLFQGMCEANSIYDLVRWGISLLIVFAGLCLKISFLSLGCKFILMSPRR